MDLGFIVPLWKTKIIVLNEQTGFKYLSRPFYGKKKQPETNPNACPLKSQKDQMFCCISEVVSKAIRNALDKENPYLRTTLVHYLT